MAANIKSKEIQVQKPAQSLQAFQAKIASGEDAHSGMLKMALIGAGSVVAVALLGFGFASWRSHAIEKHEVALADLILEVQGDGQAAVPPAEMEKRMREKLPKLEALAVKAPSACRASTQGILNSWRLELDGKAAAAPVSTDAWGKLRLAQRQIALSQGQEALATLTPLRGDATPSKAWASLYWNTLLEARRIQGDRDAAWKDLAEYKARFRDEANTAAMERVIAGI